MSDNEDFKSQIKQLWNGFWSGGISNPLSAIEQISYLIFLKRLEELDNQESANSNAHSYPFKSRFEGHEDCRWSQIIAKDPLDRLPIIKERAFPFMKSLSESFSYAMEDAVFIIHKPSLLQNAMEVVDQINTIAISRDIQGDVYEVLLSELNLSGKNGQFRTARHIIKCIVDLVAPEPGERVCDPAAGTAGFLVEAYQRELAEASDAQVLLDSDNLFVGYDIDKTMVRLGLMNLILHGVKNPSFHYCDTLSNSFEPTSKFDVVLANPPFTGRVDKKELNPDLAYLETTKTELLFIDLCLRLLKPGGRAAIIVPEGVLFGSSKAHKKVRKKLIEECGIEAVISLPSGCFRPYTGVKTSVLYFTKDAGPTDRIWFYQVSNDGFTLDDRRLEIDEDNDLLYLREAFLNRDGSGSEKWSTSKSKEAALRNSWWATYDEVVARDLVLSANIYQPPSENEIQCLDPVAMLDRLRTINSELGANIIKIEGFVASATDEHT